MATATERRGRGRGSREAQGGEAQLVGVLTGGGAAWSRGGVGDRGGRAVVEDEHGDVGRYSPRRGWPRVHGIVGRLGEGLIRRRGFAGDEFG